MRYQELQDLKEITKNIKKVTTRYQSRQKSCAGEKQKDLPKQSIKIASKPNVYGVIYNDVK